MLQVYWFVNKISSVDKHSSTVLNEEIRTAKFCDQVFVMPERFMSKVNIL